MRTSDFRFRPGTVGRALATAALGGLLLAVGATTPAAAQEGAQSDTVPHFQLDSLVVSVLRTPVRVTDAPYPVSAVGAQDLRQGKTGMYLEEALQGLPGVQVQNRYNYAVGERVTIRGFGARSQFGSRGIQVLVDGIPATLPDGQSTLDHIDIGSLGRVEALRGPAAALYGNAAGGVLRFQTEIPAASPLDESVTAMGGSDGLLRLQSTTSGTAGSTGYLLSLDRLSYGGFRTLPDSLGGGHYGNAHRMHVNGRLEQPLGGGSLGVTLNYLDLNAQNPGSLTSDMLAQDPHQIHRFYDRFQTGKEVQQGQLGLTWKGPLGDAMSVEAMAYGIHRNFLNPIPFNVIDVGRNAGGGRLVLGTPDRPDGSGLRLRGGVEVETQDDHRREYGNNGGAKGDLNLNQIEKVTSTGVFGQANLPLTDRLNAVAGARYDRFVFSVDDRFPVTPDNPDDSGRRTMDAFSPTVGLDLRAAPGVDLFGNYSTFFETPTTVELGNRPSGAGGFNPNLQPSKGWSVEGGARGTVGSQRLTYEVSVFATRLRNEFVQFEIPTEAGVTYYRNAGRSKHDGAEAVLRARLVRGLTGQLTYTYTNARFTKYEVGGENYAGNQVPGLSPHEVQANLHYEPGPWYADITADYRDKVPVDDANSAYADAYTLLDVRVGGDHVPLPGGWTVSPFAGIRNLTDQVYTASVSVNAFGGRYYEPGPGRTFYLGVSTGWASR